VQRLTGKRVLIGDLSQPRGGPMLPVHSSHQNGLDADVWYQLMPPGMMVDHQGLSAQSHVKDLLAPGLKANWEHEQTLLLKTVASHPSVARVLVNPAIKHFLCAASPVPRPSWLVKVRPWWGHADHLHVRIKCPKTAKSCQPQKPPTKVACDDELQWWFSEEAKRLSEERRIAVLSRSKDAPQPVVLPKQCQALLR